MMPVTGTGRFVFPSPRTAKRPLSDNGMLAALRRMGYEQGVLTVHGFRSTASTLLNEQGWNPDAIERQLAHSERDGVRAAYNYAEYLPERQDDAGMVGLSRYVEKKRHHGNTVTDHYQRHLDGQA